MVVVEAKRDHAHLIKDNLFSNNLILIVCLLIMQHENRSGRSSSYVDKENDEGFTLFIGSLAPGFMEKL